jgi:photosystem II stability/assembly factor-like uncharacterized protein
MTRLRRPLILALVGLTLAACSSGGTGGGARGSSPSTLTGPSCVPTSGTPAPGDDQSVPALAAVQVVSPQQVWGAGASLIVHTADGGRTWAKQYGGPERLISLDFVDASHGWAVSASTLLATDDGGRCWSERSHPSPALHAVHFVDQGLGWGVAADTQTASPTPNQGGVLVRSTDGGRSWARQPAAADVQSACFADLSQGWLTAAGRLFRTGNGGADWTPVALPTISGEAWTLATAQCAPGVAWVLATDGGAAGHIAHALYWVAVGQPPRVALVESFTHPVAGPASPTTYPGPLSAVSAANAVMAGFTPAFLPGQAARLAVVVDDGLTLRPPGAPIPELLQPTGASFASVDVGWVVGEVPGSGIAPRQGPGVVAATTDGGRTWVIQYRTS